MSAAPRSVRQASDSGIHRESPKTIVAPPNTPTAISIFSPTSDFRGRIAKKAAVRVAPTAGAEITTKLGSCTKPKPPRPNLQRLTVSNPVRVAKDGTPSGNVGVNVRNWVEAYNGSGVSLTIDIWDVAAGKIVGFAAVNDFDGCTRHLWRLRDLYTATGDVGLKLRPGRLYVARATGGFLDFWGNDPTYGLGDLAFPVTWFWTTS